MNPLVEKGKLYYLASPYSKYHLGINAAFQHVAKLSADLLRAGITVYSPVAHTHPISQYGHIDPYNHDIWLPFDSVMIDVCHGALVARLNGWDQSYGVKWEIEQFVKAGKPVIHLEVLTTWDGHPRFTDYDDGV